MLLHQETFIYLHFISWKTVKPAKQVRNTRQMLINRENNTITNFTVYHIVQAESQVDIICRWLPWQPNYKCQRLSSVVIIQCIDTKCHISICCSFFPEFNSNITMMVILYPNHLPRGHKQNHTIFFMNL